MGTENLTGAAFSKYGTSRVRHPDTLEQSARWRFADTRSNINALFRERRCEALRGAARGGGVHTLYCVYVTSRRLNLHAARERAMKYSRRRHGRHATCARTMHRTGFGCCFVPPFSFQLTPPFSPRGEKGQISILLRIESAHAFYWKTKEIVCSWNFFVFMQNEENGVKE